MRKWMLKAGATDADGLTLVDAPEPQPGPGEVRIRTRAVSINYRDQLVLGGGPFRTPGRDLTPLSDIAGEIDAVGPGVEGWSLGDRVTDLHFRGWTDGPPKPGMGFGLGAGDEDGVLAEQVVLPASRITRMPRTATFAEAATLPCAGVTAWNGLFAERPIGPGAKLLILGSGGVALSALMLARAAGAQVFATTSQDAKADRLKTMGVVDVVNYRDTPEWGAAVFGRTGGVDKVLDTGGTGTLNQSLAAVAYGGEVALAGLFDLSGGPPDAFSLLGKGAVIRGLSTGNARMHEALVRGIDAGGLKPTIDRRFAFEDAPSAFRAQIAPELFGKVVIDVG